MKTGRLSLKIRMEELLGGIYTIGSCFGAVHVVASKAMPVNRSLGEYIAIANILGKLVARIFEQLSDARMFPVPLISTSISLLVCMISKNGNKTPPISRAAVGFSLTGNESRRRKSIAGRKRNLPLLKLVERKEDIKWAPGNCAEPEVFALLGGMFQNTEEEANMRRWRKSDRERLSVCLTSQLVERKDGHTVPMKGKRFCAHCKELAEKLSQELSCRIFDLAFLDEEGPRV
jgi:hypothetical protein